MPYTRVWIPELNQWKIIGEDTGEYKEIYDAYPGATQINIPASTGQVLITTPTGMEIVGAIPDVGQIRYLERPYEITPYTPPLSGEFTPTKSTWYGDTYSPGGFNFLGIGIIGLISLIALAFGKKRK